MQRYKENQQHTSLFKKNINENCNFFPFLTKRTQNKQIHLIYIYGSRLPFKLRIQFCRSLPNYKKRRHQVRPHALSSSYLTLNVKVFTGATNTIPVYSSVFVRPLFGNMVVSVLTAFLLYMVYMI